MKIFFSLFLSFIFLISYQLDKNEVRIFMVGDSTMANKSYTPGNPEKGWGQIFPLYFKEGVEVFNHAVNGRSTKNFREEGRWDIVMNQVQKGDYVFIQFGHNDQKVDDPNRYASPDNYKINLSRYVQEAREKEAIPILATPLSRRSFDTDGTLKDTHLEYTLKMKEVANEMDVILLDMNATSRALLTAWGVEKSKELYMHIEPGQYDRFPEGIVDNTHFSPTGAFRICDLAVTEIKEKIPAIAAYFKD
ncbi:lysophospholipase L1-like esterase [Belliella baltica DSM 15883]|uniref:Lysophospholipase L1-like esterase n=1 Tax=Belliella baltica (strain DSM 15883 / CIP 108006 / LMG 21964 / BA134) TaxID=866536 RepID=I3Z733_BELBD|nr:rhamnogalacturonan acetylesterase [Belliella baltica]AFL85051.1 lysophospholipase L1-like esterase [Belliella baltica DSM 15883]